MLFQLERLLLASVFKIVVVAVVVAAISILVLRVARLSVFPEATVYDVQ